MRGVSPIGAIYDALVRTVFLDPDGTISDWLGVVVAASTGVQYEHQCGGTACFHRSLEGYYVPIGGVADASKEEWRMAAGWRELREFFANRVGIESPRQGAAAWKDPTALADLHRLVGTIPWWVHGGAPTRTERIPLTIDSNREAEIVEGWIPVLLGEDGSGTLVWPNSD